MISRTVQTKTSMCAFLGSGRTDEVTEFSDLSSVRGEPSRTMNGAFTQSGGAKHRAFFKVLRTRDSSPATQTDIHKMAIVPIPVIAPDARICWNLTQKPCWKLSAKLQFCKVGEGRDYLRRAKLREANRKDTACARFAVDFDVSCMGLHDGFD